jgi:hypothetical protein
MNVTRATGLRKTTEEAMYSFTRSLAGTVITAGACQRVLNRCAMKLIARRLQALRLAEDHPELSGCCTLRMDR